MVKQVIERTFSLASEGGRRRSRGGPDVTPPTAPVLADPVTNTTFIDIAWINGVDAHTGIKETLVEYRRNSTADWIEFSRVEYPGSQETIDGLTPGTPYDIRVTNFDNATPTPNGMSSSTKTVSTLGTSADLEPGSLALAVSSISIGENQQFQVSAIRTGGGASSPAVECQLAFSGFPEGTPSPGNVLLHWDSGENGVQSQTVTAGAVGTDRTGSLRIVSATALSGTLQPTFSNTAISVTIQDSGSQSGIKWHPGHYVRADLSLTGASIISADLNAVNAHSAVKGIEIAYKWAALEPTRGNYQAGFTLIDGHLSQLGSKRLIIHLVDRSFGGNSASGILPGYLSTELGGGELGYWVKPNNAGVIAKLWRPGIADRKIALSAALGARYNSHPRVEIVMVIDESAPGAVTGDPTYSQGGYATQIKRIATEVAPHWPNTTVCSRTNFLSGQVSGLLAHFNSLNAAHGGPDVAPLPHAETVGGQVWRGLATDPSGGTPIDYRGTVACCYVAASTPYATNGAKDTTNYGRNGVGYTAQEFYDHMIDHLKVTHACWVRRENGTAQWTAHILPLIIANPNLITACPTNYSSCNTA